MTVRAGTKGRTPMKCARLSVVAAVLLGFLSGSATAGSKYIGNIVPTGVSPPTLSNKSKFILKGNGQFKSTLKGVTDSSGLVTTERSGAFNGDEYVTVLSGVFVALGQLFRFNLVTELKKGKGTSKIDASKLFVLVPKQIEPRSVHITNVEVYGPLGAENAAACQELVNDNFPVLLSGQANPCVDESATAIAVGGITVAR